MSLPNQLVQPGTRRAFREFLVKHFKLQEIRNAFDSAGIVPISDSNSEIKGERRKLVEQYYAAVDCHHVADARLLVDAFERILRTAILTLETYEDVENLKFELDNDGLIFENNRIKPVTQRSRMLFEHPAIGYTISRLTKQTIFDELESNHLDWWGRLPVREFLRRLYPIEEMQNLEKDIGVHFEWNDDWPFDWVLDEPRIDLLGVDDKEFLRFLCEMVHPYVRPDENDRIALVKLLNKHLSADGWALLPNGAISSRPVFTGRPIVNLVPLPREVLNLDGYVRELADKCDTRFAEGDLEGAITVGRTLLEVVLRQLEQRLRGTHTDYGGSLQKQYKEVSRLLRLDEKRDDLDDRFKDVIRGLVTVVSGIAPIRNKLSDGHARAYKPSMHHARVVVNAARTVSVFLVESYLFQKERGLLKDAASN
ncbi:MAG: abortive infection family protein [Myxococcota bacterium]|nr:abortive infection family protein [Myxococcota bacterium]